MSLEQEPTVRQTEKDVHTAGLLASRTFIQALLPQLVLVDPVLVSAGVDAWKTAAITAITSATAAGVSRAQSYLRERWS